MGHTPLSYLGIPMTPKASFTNPLQSMIEVNTSNETTEEGDNKHTGHIADSSGCAILVTTWKDGTPRVMSAGLSQNGSTLVFRPTDFTESKKDFKLLSDSLRKSEVDKDQRGCSLEPSQQKHSEVKIDGINDIREVCYEDKETKRINVHIEGVENSSERKKHKHSQRTQSEMKNDDLNDGREVCNDGKTITRTKDHIVGVANSTERKKHKPSQRIHSDMKNDDINDGREICNGRKETEETNDEIKGVAHSVGIKKHKSPSSKSDVTDSNKVIGKETTERIHSHIDKARPDNEKTGLNETLIQSNSVSNLLTNNQRVSQSSDQEKCKKVERRSSICEERPTKTQEITQNNIEGIPDKQHGHERVKNSETRTGEKMDQQRKDRYVDKTQLVNHEQLGTECRKSTGTVKVHKTPIIKKNVKENTFEKTHSMANKCQSYEGDKTITTHTKLSNSDHCVNNVDKANVQSLSEGLSTKRPLVDVEKERKNVKERTFGQTHSIENKCKTIDGDKISRTNTELRNKSEHGVNKVDKADVQKPSKKLLPNEKAVYEEKERKSVNEYTLEKFYSIEKKVQTSNGDTTIKTNDEQRQSGKGVYKADVPQPAERLLTTEKLMHEQKERKVVNKILHEKKQTKEKNTHVAKTPKTNIEKRESKHGVDEIHTTNAYKPLERLFAVEKPVHKPSERLFTLEKPVHEKKERLTINERAREKTHVNEKKSQVDNSVNTATTSNERKALENSEEKEVLPKAYDCLLTSGNILHERKVMTHAKTRFKEETALVNSGVKTITIHTEVSKLGNDVLDTVNSLRPSERSSTKETPLDVRKDRTHVKDRTHSIDNNCHAINGDKKGTAHTELRKSEPGVDNFADVQTPSEKVSTKEAPLNMQKQKQRKHVNERRHEKKQLTEKNIHVNNSVKKIKTNTERRDSGNGVEQVGLPIAPEQILTKQTTLHVQKGRHTVDKRTHEKTHLKEKKSQLNNSVKTTTTHTKRRVSESGGEKVGSSKASERILMKETTLHKKKERSSSERTIHGESADSESPSHVSSRTSDDTKSKSSPTQSIKHGNCTPIIINTSGKLNLEEVRWQFPDKTKAPGSNENPSKSLDVLPKRKYGDHLHDGDVSSSEMKKRRMYVAEMFDELPKRLLEKQTYPEIKTISEENTTDNAKKTESYSANNTERSTSMSQAKHKSIRQLMGAAKVHLKSSESSNADKPSANGQKESLHGCEGSLEHAGENVYMGETINVDKTAISGDEERTTTFKCQLCNHSCLDIRKFEKHKLLCKTKGNAKVT